MARDQGMIIARRSISLTKTYPIIGIFLSVLGVVFSSLSGLIGSASSPGTATVDTTVGIPYLAVPFQALAALMFSTPVLLLFVYDKNNGVLEYLMSLGFTQGDIYKQYLKAALILVAPILSFGIAVDVVVGTIQGMPVLTLEISGLVVAFALAAVSFGSLLMMSFSSLQKQRTGSNQPLGVAIGSLMIFPAYFLPLVNPSLAFLLDLLLASVVAGLSLLTYSFSSRWISREKLLP